MKKTLVALAALAATSAFAQSTVTLYGNADISVVNGKNTTTNVEASTSPNAATAGKNIVAKTFGLGGSGGVTKTSLGSNYSSNNIGLMGSEDLGNGLKANFKLENSLTSANGDGSAATSMLGGAARETWAGLSGGFGEVRAGYQYTDEFAVVGMGEAGSGNFISHINGLPGMGRQLRHDMVSYTSPAFGGGFTANVQWGQGKAKSVESATGVADKTTEGNAKHQSLGLKYANGPLNLAFGTRTGKTDAAGVLKDSPISVSGAAYAQRTAATMLANSGVEMSLIAAGTGNDGKQYEAHQKTKANYLAGNYDFGAYKVFAGYVTHKTTGEAILANVAQDNQLQKNSIRMIGVQAPIGKFTPWFSYQTATNKFEQKDKEVDTTKFKGMSLGTTYSLSKRTTAYAAYNQLTYKDTNLNAALSEEGKIKTTIVGLRHQF